MSVNRAYISSLWTTAILVGSSILLLAVTSAIVAFDGWPGDSANAPVDRVTVAPPAVGAEPVAATAATAVSAAARAAVVAVRVRRAPAGRAPTGGPAPTPQGGRSRSGVPDTASAPSPRASSSSSPGQAPPGTPSGSPRAGDPVRSTGGRIDRGIAPVSPQAGHTALELSETVAQVVDGAGPATVRAGR